MARDRSISVAVQTQYEEHPYPVWEALPNYPITDDERDVLFAGCGTGFDILSNARAAPRSRFVGIDLSSASLDFARSKAEQYGIGNVTLKQLNILDVASLGATFDHIKSTGVLHHMERPLKGLLALKSVLRPGGTIKFAVYSKAARASALAAIALRKEMGIQPTDEGIEQFRAVIMALPPEHPAAAAARSPDFQSIAGTRDLLFHVLEHNFTIPELIGMVSDAGLEVIQWGPSTAARKLESLGYAYTNDWRIWHEAEQKRPALFANGMYSLTVRVGPR